MAEWKEAQKHDLMGKFTNLNSLLKGQPLPTLQNDSLETSFSQIPRLVSILLIQKPEHKQKHQTTLMHALRTIVRFKELTGSRIEVLKFKIVWSFQGHAKSFCMPLPPPQDVLREAPRPSTHISKVEQLCISLLYQGPLQKETEEILLAQ